MEKVIIAPINMHLGILKNIRKEDPFINCKIFSKEQLIKDFFGTVTQGGDIEVLKNFDLTYEMVLEILSDITYFNNKKDGKFDIYDKIYRFLEEHKLISKNNLFKQFFSRKEIDVYGYNENDRILNYVLNETGCNVKYYNPSINIKNKSVNNFKYVSDECLYVLNSIAALIDQGVSHDDIYIYNASEIHKYYLDKYSESFNIKINNLHSQTYFLSGICTIFIKKYDEIRDINEALKFVEDTVKDDVILDDFIELIKENIHLSLPYEKQKDLLLNKFKSEEIKKDKYKPAIKLINGPIYNENAHIFVMDFSLGAAPKIYKDNAYLSDIEKAGTYIYTSKEKNQNSRFELLYFLSLESNFYFSRSDIVDNTNSYPTSFINEFGFSINYEPKIYTYYSPRLLDISYVKALDLYNSYLEKSEEYIGLAQLSEIKYKVYDNQFNGVSAIEKDDVLSLSYSSINDFCSCPFKYYLNRVLKVSNIEETFSLKIGNIAHKVFEKECDKDFGFLSTFDDVVKGFSFNPMETLLINNLKENIRLAVESSLKHIKEFSSNPTVYFEEEIKFKLDEHTIFTGKIDKIVSVDNRYYYVVDYKSGSTTFSDKYLHLGKGTQLIVYTILTDHFEALDNMQIAGFYYNNIIPSELALKQIDEEDITPTYLKLKGKTLDEKDVISRIDTSFINSNAASFIHGIKLNTDGSFSKATSSLISREGIEEYKQIVKEVITNVVISIRNNDFKIEPKCYSSNDNACNYCEHRDICFRRHEQIIFVNEIGEEDENSGME